MEKRIVIGGYYGYKSLGDEAVLAALIDNLRARDPQCHIYLLCASPAHMEKKLRVKCIHRYDPLGIIRAMSRSRLYISGGGSLMQDKTSRRSLYYYCAMINLAKAMGLKVYAYSNGVGPLTNLKAAGSALEKCDHISVRDKASQELLTSLNIESALTADPIFLHQPADRKRTAKYLTDRGIYTDKYFTVSLRRCKGKRQINEDALLHALLPFIIDGYTPIFVSMQDKCDLALCAAMADMTGGFTVSPSDAEILMGLQKCACFAIGMRLHFLLAAAAVETPFLALSYDPKVDNVLKYVADADSMNAFDFDAELISSYFSENRQVQLNRSALKALALSDIDAVFHLLSSEADLVKA